MSLTSALVTLTCVSMIVAGATSCAAGSRDVGRSSYLTIRSSPASADRDPSLPPSAFASDALSAAELAVATLSNASIYDALLRLRPTFLHRRDARRGVISARGVLPAVFVDGTHVGGVDALRLYTVSAIADVQFVRSFDAVHRYGPEYGAGIVFIRLKRR